MGLFLIGPQNGFLAKDGLGPGIAIFRGFLDPQKGGFLAQIGVFGQKRGFWPRNPKKGGFGLKKGVLGLKWAKKGGFGAPDPQKRGFWG